MDPGDSRLRERLSPAVPWLLAALGFAALHVSLDWHTWLAPSTTMRGWPGDNLMFAWNLWWVSSAIWDLPGTGAVHCPIVFHPDGFSFPFHTHTWLYGAIYALAQTPWRIVGAAPPGPAFAYNVFMLASTVLTGIGTMLLLAASGVRPMPARFLASLALVFGSFRIFSLYGLLNFAGTEFFVLSAWAHVVAMQRPDARSAWRWSLAAGAFAALAFLNDSTLGIFAGLFGGLAFVFAAVRVLRRRAKWHALLAAMLSPLAAIILCSWQLAELVRVGRTPDYFIPDLWFERFCEPLNLVIPSQWNALLGDSCQGLRDSLGIPAGWGSAFLGASSIAACIALVLAFAFSRAFRRATTDRAVFWIAVAAVALFLSVGDALFFRGQRICQWPAYVLHLTPGLSNLRVPERFLVFASMAMAVGAGHLLEFLHASVARRLWLAAASVWIALVGLDACWKNPHFRVDEPPIALPEVVVGLVRSETPQAEGAILELPYSWIDRGTLFRQTVHRRPIVFGTAARVSPALIARRQESWPFLGGLDDQGQPSVAQAIEEGHGALATRAQLAGFLADHDVLWIVVDRSRLPDSADLGALMPNHAKLAFKNDGWLVWEFGSR